MKLRLQNLLKARTEAAIVAERSAHAIPHRTRMPENYVDEALDNEDYDAPTYPDTPFQRVLVHHGACDEARAWVGARTLANAWAACPNTNWRNWLLATCADATRDRAEHAHPDNYARTSIDARQAFHTYVQRTPEAVDVRDVARWLGLSEAEAGLDGGAE